MLLVLASSDAAADWVLACHGEIFTSYVDPTTIRRSGDIAQMWDLHNFTSAQTLGPDKSYLSSKMQEEYDCKERRARMLYISWYSQNMGEGEMVGRDSEPNNWRPVSPGCIVEVHWEFACGKR